MEALDGLPPVKVHCSLLAEEGIHAALWDYAEKNGIVIEGLKKPKNDIYLAFTVQEEVGTRGGQVTAQRIQPDIGVAVDVTPCHDRPGDLEGSNALDHGVAIKISDTGSISDEGLVNKSIALCKEHNVPYQKDVIYVGGTDAGAMTLVGGGIKTIGFSVVTRYTHGPNAIVSQKDIEATVKMLELFMNADFE